MVVRMEQENKFRQAFWVTVVGSAVNLLLAIIKIGFGYVSHSSAVFADGIHSLSDLISDALVIILLKMSGKPATRAKPFGNRKLESIAALVIAMILVGVVLAMIFEVINNPSPKDINNTMALVIVVISVVAKESLFQWTNFKGKKLNSPAIIANAWHHRSDALSSVAVLFCLILGHFFGHMRIWDIIGAGMVSIMILHAAWEISKNAYKELLDYTPSLDIIDKIEQIADDHADVTFTHHVRARSVGGVYHLSLLIETPGDKTVRQTADIMESLKQSIQKAIPETGSILISIYPTGYFAGQIRHRGIENVRDEDLF